MRNKKLTDKDEQELIIRYKNGETSRTLAVDYDITPTSIRRICNRNNVSTSIWNVDDSIINKIIFDYKENNFGSKILAKKYHISPNRIIKLLKENNIEINRQQKYWINETYFDNIDSEYKAYFLGLLYADGCKYKNRVQLFLQEKDKNIIEIFNNIIQPQKPIRIRIAKKESHQNSYGIVIENKILSEKIKRLGVVESKTFKLTFPDWLNKELYNHFIRGYFDGDGCISLTSPGNRKRLSSWFSFISTKLFLDRVNEIFENETGVRLIYTRDIRFSKDNVNIYIGYSGGNYNVIKIMDWLYKDATIYFNRKFEKYKIIKEQNSDGKYKHDCKSKTV